MKFPQLFGVLSLATMLPMALAQTAPAPATTTAGPTTTATTAPDTTSEAPKAPVPAEVKKLIADSIALLEAGKNEEAVALLAGPTVVAQMKSEGAYDDTIARFKTMAPDLIKALKAAQTTTHFSATESQVRFDPAEGTDRPLSFNHTKDGWQLK